MSDYLRGCPVYRGSSRVSRMRRFHRPSCSYLPGATLKWRWPVLRGYSETEVLLRTFLVPNRVQPCLHCFPRARLLRDSPPEVCEDCDNILELEKHASWCGEDT